VLQRYSLKEKDLSNNHLTLEYVYVRFRENVKILAQTISRTGEKIENSSEVEKNDELYQT